jgi:hypothetical protein
MSNIIVKRTRIHVTPQFEYVTYSAWVPYDYHGTYTRIDGVKVGKVGTERHTALESLRGEERMRAADEWRAARYAEAYAAIVAEYPHLFSAGTRCMGEIEETIRTA